MTTIATDGKTIAAESRSIGSFIVQGDVKKLYRLKDGRVAGTCGASWATEVFIQWMNGEGEKPVIEDGFGALVLGEEVTFYCSKLSPLIVKPPYAIGSGCEFAMGAMLAGKSPKEAVKIAIKLDEGSGGKITVMRPK